ncbi:MAG: hypothetical protein MI892_21355 [Desulfobacterales bacterium]|nr:hypothetical protein [Desulfobacterales bacterium]
MAKHWCSIFICLFFLASTGCSTSHEVEVKPVEIKPIHITIDVNVKVDKALDDFFGDIDAAEDQLEEGEVE